MRNSDPARKMLQIHMLDDWFGVNFDVVWVNFRCTIRTLDNYWEIGGEGGNVSVVAIGPSFGNGNKMGTSIHIHIYIYIYSYIYLLFSYDRTIKFRKNV